MPTFTYRAVDGAGERTRGRLEAPTPAAVAHALEARGLLALEVEAADEAGGSSGRGGLGRRRHVLEFTRAVAALLPAGMPLPRALAAATAATPEPLHPVIESVRRKVERGDELAGALAEHPRHFSALYVGIIRAGEKSGALDAAFERLAANLERQEELRSKLVSMAIYPALLALVGVGAVLVLILFVLPRFAELLEGAGAALPTATALVLSASTAAREGWPVLVGALVLAIAAGAWFRGSQAGRAAASKLLVRLPLVRSWRRQALGAAFARMVGELLAGGAPLLEALADARDCMTDDVARSEADAIRSRVREGGSLHESIARSGIFPVVLPQLVALGEESGRLADFLLKAADLLERQLERTVERLVAIAEPAMIVAFGGIVALVALALLQAIYGVNAGALQ